MKSGHHRTIMWKLPSWLAVVAWFAGAFVFAQDRSLAPAQDSVQQPAGSANVHSEPALQQRPRYRIEPGDVLDLGFDLSPEFNQTVTVAPDGYISLRGLNDLQVSGKSLPELREALRQAYSSILHNPIISVELRDYQKPYFIVGGQVGHPGKYDLREDITASEALAIAGGATTSAKSSDVLLFRHLPGGSMTEVRKLNFDKMMKRRDLREDVYLQPGDMLFVPRNTISKIERFIPTSEIGMYAPGIP
jgi:polysaccharide biosynthesis/export protein